MKSGGGDLNIRGWARLPYRFNTAELDNLSELNPHIERGQRLTDMQAVSDALPTTFKNTIKQMGFDPTPNRAVGFTKSKDSNWALPWHQDRVIAMAHQNDDPAYTNWSRKSGIWHCEPPEGMLKQMAFAYIAFDEISGGMGGLEIAETSHRFGKIESNDISIHILGCNIVRPNLTRGDVLLISALTLHRSAAMSEQTKRRTLRIDFREFNEVVENFECEFDCSSALGLFLPQTYRFCHPARNEVKMRGLTAVGQSSETFPNPSCYQLGATLHLSPWVKCRRCAPSCGMTEVNNPRLARGAASLIFQSFNPL